MSTISGQVFTDILKAGYRFKERTSETALQNGINISEGAETLPLKSACFENIGFAVLRSNDNFLIVRYLLDDHASEK